MRSHFSKILFIYFAVNESLIKLPIRKYDVDLFYAIEYAIYLQNHTNIYLVGTISVRTKCIHVSPLHDHFTSDDIFCFVFTFAILLYLLSMLYASDLSNNFV